LHPLNPWRRALWIALSSLAAATLLAALSVLTPAAPNLWPLIGVAALLLVVLGSLFIVAPRLAGILQSNELGSRLALAVLLVIASSFHLLLLEEHAAESPLLGLGFLGSGLIQLGLATAVVVRPSLFPYYGVVALNVALIALYAAHVVIGLPLAPTAQGGFTLGPTEDVDAVGLATKAAELFGLTVAFVLARSAGRRSGGAPAPGGQQQHGG